LLPSLPILFLAANKLTTYDLAKTIFYQVGVLGCGTFFGTRYIVPWLNSKSGLHPITGPDQAMIASNPVLRLWFRKATKWFDHPILMLGGCLVWGTAFIMLTGTLYVLITDIGWLTAWNLYGFDPDYVMLFLMARAGGQPNGAHLPSYISIALMGCYAAWKYRKGVFIDVYQGILIVGFAVGIHEGIWLGAYFFNYYGLLGLALNSNFVEDFFFWVMCVILVGAFWKYPFRSLPLRAFKWPIVGYAVFVLGWLAVGLPVSTINNWVIGQDIYGTTKWFLDPLVNGIEIASWLYIAGSFFLVVKRADA
jgi:hypothetical protein